MPVIRMDILAEVYARYNFAIYESERDSIIEDGVKSILLRLKRYMRNPEKFEDKSKQAMGELEAVLERFYYQDGKFSKLIHAKARAYVQKHAPLETGEEDH